MEPRGVTLVNRIKKQEGKETLKPEGGAYHLPGNHADGLDAEFATTHVE